MSTEYAAATGLDAEIKIPKDDAKRLRIGGQVKIVPYLV